MRGERRTKSHPGGRNGAKRRGIGCVAPAGPLGAACAAVLLGVAGGRAQVPVSRADSLARADSAALVERARATQGRFEATRREYMPFSLAEADRACEERVGRICWHHQTESWWRAEREVPAVHTARQELVSELDRIARELPGDDWLIGQRIWYLVEMERIDDALALARSCAGTRWWCSALQGLMLHLRGRYLEAEAAFDRALATGDSIEVGRWISVDLLLDQEQWRGLRRLEQASGGSLEGRGVGLRRLWALADPMRMVPGNDRMTEHYARRTIVRIRSEAVEPYGIAWGEDLAEVLLRYGWEVGWERPLPGGGFSGDVAMVGHDHADSRGYLPPGPLLADPLARQNEPWVPSNAFSRSAYAPAYAPVMMRMPARVVALTRGDSSLVAAVFELPADTSRLIPEGHWRQHLPPDELRGAPREAGLFLSDLDGVEIRSVREPNKVEGVLELMAPAGDYAVSVEVLDPSVWRAARLRDGLAVPRVAADQPTLSELLVLDGDEPPADVHDALARLRLVDEMAPDERFVVAWELWGLGRQEEMLRYTLSVREADRGLLRSVGDLFGIGERAGIEIEWEEPGPSAPGAALRSAAMELPSLDPGEYVLRLEVVAPGRNPIVSEQRVRVVEGGAGDDPGGGEPGG